MRKKAKCFDVWFTDTERRLRLHELSQQYSDGRKTEPTPLAEEAGLTALQNEKGGLK